MCWENGQLVLRCSSLQLIFSSFSRLLHRVMSIITMPAALLYTAALMVPSLMPRSPFFTSNFKLSINLPMPRLEKTPQNFFFAVVILETSLAHQKREERVALYKCLCQSHWGGNEEICFQIQSLFDFLRFFMLCEQAK